MKTQIIPFQYDRAQIKAGIVHIGVGNFHRAHEAFFTDKLLIDATQSKWGICGAMLLPGDERLFHALKKQDNIYTLTVCGRDGKDEVHRIGSLVELIWGVENPQAVLDRIAAPATRIITLTITEGGYNIDKHTGEFILNNKNVVHDLINPHVPKTVFGFIAEGLRRRKEKGSGAITILSCDNLQHNGDTAKRIFTAFITAQDAELAGWVSQNVTFPNSMVDRITPATTPSDIGRLNLKNGTDDKAPVYCEDFIQWVIEDRFIAGRPAWEKVGVEFTDDVTTYENMKLSLLNASHTMLSYPAFLSGYRKVDDSMHDQRFIRYLRKFMDKDISPYISAPGNTDLESYKQTLIERFGNRSVSDQLSRLCADGISKIPIYVMPNLTKMVCDNADLTRVAFLFAAYRHYLKYKVDDKGESYEINEPWLTVENLELISSNEPVDFLGLSPFASTALKANHQFTDLFLRFVGSIKENGILPIIETILVCA
jgi:mannitol 2-dehydrogenase